MPTVRDETIVLNGLRFHYREWGDPAAPALVLLHAYTSHARSWDTFAAGMADRFRVLALDQRGHGESDWAEDYHEQRLVEDVVAFADALGLTTLSIVGFSIGGGAACSYAARHPDRVERLVAFECFTDGNETGDDPYLQVMRAHLSQLRALPQEIESPDEAMEAYRPLAPHAPDDELRHWITNGLRQQPDGRWIWRYDPAFRTPGPPGRLVASMNALRNRLARVTCPILLPVGVESWMVTPTEQIATANPRARVSVIPRADHWIPLDNPGCFLNIVGGFLWGE